MSGLHPDPMQPRLENMQSSLFALISVERTWRRGPKWSTAPGRVQNFGTTDLYLLYRFNSCLQKVTFRRFWSDCFWRTGRLGSISVNWLDWSDSFLYRVCGVLFQGASLNSLHAKFSINRKYWIQSIEVHLNAFSSLRVFGIEFMHVEIPCIVGLYTCVYILCCLYLGTWVISFKNGLEIRSPFKTSMGI